MSSKSHAGVSRTNIEWRPVYTLLVILPKRAWVTPYGVWWLLTAPAKGTLLKLSTVETETKTDPRFLAQEASGRILSGYRFSSVYTQLVTLTKRAWVAPYGVRTVLVDPVRDSL